MPDAIWIKTAVFVAGLAALWSWEALQPFFVYQRGRLRHDGRNLAIAAVNTVTVALCCGIATVFTAEWTERNDMGLLQFVEIPWFVRLLLALVLLDVWLYAWHRANHAIPFLWRFHRMHHSDLQLDVSTATRFHTGELLMAAALRLGLIPLFGIELTHLIVFETLVMGVTLFHHANISLGRWDASIRWLIVTPFMHKVHHSRRRPETNSNYATLFSVWDRLFRSFRICGDCSTIQPGLDEFDDSRWQTFGGMLKTPFVGASGDRRHASA
jgi:sterol desaturase/sphingolipid hydroxylase (fatty acid hydroxylase superfamily)